MSTEKEISKADLAKHNTRKDLWLAVHGKVHNVSSYIEDHPGGVDSLLEVAGTDATEAFEDLGHTQDARDKLATLEVGTLQGHAEAQGERSVIQRHLRPVAVVSKDEQGHHGSLVESLHLHPSSLGAFSAAAVASYVLLKTTEVVQHREIPIIPAIMSHLPSMLYVAPVAIVNTIAAGLLLSYFQRQYSKTTPNLHHYKTHQLTPERPAATVASHAVLKPLQYITLPITQIQSLSSNTKAVTLKLPHQKDVLGLPIGQHIAIRAPQSSTSSTSSPLVRSYTPVSNNRDRGVLKLVIKMYNDGQLTGGYLDKLSVGDTIDVCGPRGQMRYRKGMAKKIGMIAGGSGITPMFQVLRAIAEDTTDDTSVDLLFANNTQEDILLKQELDAFTAKKPGQIKVKYILATPPAGWTGLVGRVSADMVKEAFGEADDGKKVLLCGPPGLIKASEEYLKGLGYAQPRAVSKMDDQVFCF